MAKILQVYGMVLFNHLSSKPGIRMLINCERRSLDKEKQKEKRSSQLWILVVHLAAGNKNEITRSLLHIQFFLFDAIKYWEV